MAAHDRHPKTLIDNSATAAKLPCTNNKIGNRLEIGLAFLDPAFCY